MVPGIGGSFGRTRYVSYSDTSTEGWNGWLYPVLFIVLPIIACLMIIALIVCNLIEYYRKKRRLEQYENTQYSDSLHSNASNALQTHSDQRLDHSYATKSSYNEAQYTYNSIFTAQTGGEETETPVRPLSGWIAPRV